MAFASNNIDADYFLFRDGPVLVTADQSLWRKTTEWLEITRDYQRHSWRLESKSSFFDEVSRTLMWEEQFGYEPWTGNLHALVDGLSSWPLTHQEHILIEIESGEKLNDWFGDRTHYLWDTFYNASRLQVMFGVVILFAIHVSSEEQEIEIAKSDAVLRLHANSTTIVPV